jgi:hypothetical protein
MAKYVLHAIWVVAVIVATAPASALTARDLAGWWLAVDRELPSELLVVGPEGAVEDRAIQFRQISAAECVKSKRCSDAPLIARAGLTIDGDKLAFARREPGAADGAPSSLTATPLWTAALSAGNRLLTLRAGNATRILARVEPDRLRRLRAGLMVAALPADKHWRCFLTNATAGDAAFAPLRKGKHAAPAFLNDYLRIASYRSSLAALGAIPAADEPDATLRKLAGVVSLETLMAERFKDVETPRTAADARRYRAQAVFIDQRARNVSPQEANVVAGALNGGVPVAVAATGAEFSALARVAARDAEAKRLFCVD